MSFTCIDSFCGAGGLALGLKMAGFDILLSFDNDKNCIETIGSNSAYFSHPAECISIEHFIADNPLNKIGLKRGELFLLAGGPPCQGFSIQRIGKDNDLRNKLVTAYGKLLEILYPKYFLMENVPGITGKRGRRYLAAIINKAEKLGYYIHEQILDAQNYNVPQRRRRMILVGERLDVGTPNFKYPEPSVRKITVRDTIGFLPPPPEDGSCHPDYSLHRRDKLSRKNIDRLKALKEGEGRDSLPPELLADCHKLSSSKIGHRNVYGRMRWDDVSPTITARFDSFTRGMFGHPDQTRSISLREGALLQTFPLDFQFFGTKVSVARQIGNAVPVNFAYALAKQILKCYMEKIGEKHGL